MNEPKNENQIEGSKTAKPFQADEGESGKTSHGMKESPHDRADAVGDDEKQDEMSKTTQRQE